MPETSSADGSIKIARVAPAVASARQWYGFRWNGKGSPLIYLSFPEADELTLQCGDPVTVHPAPNRGVLLDVAHGAYLDGVKLDGIAWLPPAAKRPALFHVRDDCLVWIKETTATEKEKVCLLDSLGLYTEEERALLIKEGLLQEPPADQDPTAAEGDDGSTPMIRRWPELPSEALQGLAGEVVKAATDHSEADPAAVLITFLAWMGATFGYQSGQTPYFSVGDTQHAPRLYAAVVGQTSRARKGTSVGPVKRIMSEAGQSTEVQPCQFCEGPLSSGEGIIYRLRDDSEEVDDKTGEPVTPGAKDKRLMVLEGELGSTFKVAERAGNIVSTILRVAWDGGVIEPLTKNARLKSSYPHLCIVGHITHDELRSLLTSIDLRNGLANRFLWVCARRAKTVSLPKPIPGETATQTATEVAAVINAATPGPLAWSAPTIAIWEKVYPVLTQDQPGAWGYATARAEAQVVRLAMIYALLAKSRVVMPEHLTAACAVWQYCDQSAAHIFGAAETDPTANKILEALAAGELTQTEIKQRVLQGNTSAATLASVLQHLQDSGRIAQRKVDSAGRGRPTTVWYVLNAFNVKNADTVPKADTVPDLIRLIRLIRSKEQGDGDPSPPVQPDAHCHGCTRWRPEKAGCADRPGVIWNPAQPPCAGADFEPLETRL